MSEPFNPAILQPGDALLYFSHDLGSWLIALETRTKVAHVEIYRGNHISYSSRCESGVNAYPLRLDGVAAVMRPKQPLDLLAADAWFEANARGQPYDWLGLLCFTLARRGGEKHKYFCSELATHYYRAAGVEPFNPRWPADAAPRKRRNPPPPKHPPADVLPWKYTGNRLHPTQKPVCSLMRFNNFKGTRHPCIAVGNL